MNLGIPFYIRKAIQREVPAHRCAPSLEERITEKTGKDHPHNLINSKCSSYMIRNGNVRNRGTRGALGLTTNFRTDRMRLYPGVSPRLILKTRLLMLMLISRFGSFSLQHTTLSASAGGGGGEFSESRSDARSVVI